MPPKTTKTSLERAMTTEEAQACVDSIKNNLCDTRAKVMELYEGQGWIALGYKSWRACVTAEFTQSQTHLYRLLTAAKVDREISPIGEISLPESQTRELAKLPEGEKAAAYQQAAEETGGHVTAKAINELVKRRTAPPADEPDWAKAASHQLTPEEKMAKQAEMHDQLFKGDLAQLNADLQIMTEKFPDRAGDLIKFLAGWLARVRDIPGAVPAVTQRKGPARADNHTLWPQVEADGK